MPTNKRMASRLLGSFLALAPLTTSLIPATASAAAPAPLASTPLPPPGASGQLLDQGNQIDYQIRNLQKELQKSDLENQLQKSQTRPGDANASLPAVMAIEGFGSTRLATLLYSDNSEIQVHTGSSLFDGWHVSRIEFGKVTVVRKGKSTALTNLPGVASATLAPQK